MKNLYKGENGITLVALVVTIIVLLILAAVSLNLVIGENGIINRSKTAVNEYQKAALNEQIGMNKAVDFILNNVGGQNTGGGESGTDVDVATEYPTISEWIPIYTKEQLIKIGSWETVYISEENVSHVFDYSSSKGYLLKNDIDIGGGTITSLPSMNNGVFCGNNKKISNVTISGPGLFRTSFGIIGELEIENVTVYETGRNNVGAIAGSSYIVKNCTVSGQVRGNNTVGGVVGTANIIKNCTNNATVSGNLYIGGITGAGGEIINCHNKADITGQDTVGGITGVTPGGIVGGMSSGKVEDCSNRSKVTSTTSGGVGAGGIVGESGGFIKSSYNTGEVIANTRAGGIAAYQAAPLPSDTIDNVYNTGAVTANTDVGGLVGALVGSNLLNSYNIGTVTGVTNVGGVVGRYVSTAQVNCYYLNTVVSDTQATALSASSLKGYASTLGASWKIDSSNINNGYPILSWQ